MEYGHKVLMSNLGVAVKDLPADIQKHVVSHQKRCARAKDPAILEELEEYSDVIAQMITDWHDSHLEEEEEEEFEEEEEEEGDDPNPPAPPAPNPPTPPAPNPPAPPAPNPPAPNQPAPNPPPSPKEEGPLDWLSNW